jgi:hypothetical protein
MRFLVILFFSLFVPYILLAQCDDIARSSEQFFPNEYISDGQTYRALLIDDQTAEFSSVFFGGSTYRLSAYTGIEKGIIFRVLDQNRNVLFSSSDFDKVTYWDFEIENTLHCTIEAQLDPTVQNSGCAVLLIGFKE